jgi:hypothetical protein
MHPKGFKLGRVQAASSPPVDVRGESGTFRILVLLDEIERWPPTTLRENVVRIGAKVIARARHTAFQMPDVVVSRSLFCRILEIIYEL